MIDIAIIGAGPAGLSAAINAAARNRTAVVFGRKRETSWLYKAELVNNHLGMPGMTGAEMLDSFYSHAVGLGVQINEGRVTQALSMGNHYAISFENNIAEAKTLIIATGKPKTAEIKGERELVGNGVSYCATCDGMLYRGKDVVVCGETAEGEEDANFLSRLCGKVYYVYKYDSIERLDSKVISIKGIASEIIGDKYVTGVSVNSEILPCDGVFIIKEAVPAESLLAGIQTDGGRIVINRFAETNLSGVYAAGDCTGWPFQISKSIGEGLVAAQQCDRFLSQT